MQIQCAPTDYSNIRPTQRGHFEVHLRQRRLLAEQERHEIGSARAAFDALSCWLEENHKRWRPATETAQAVAQFNAQALTNEAVSPKWQNIADVLFRRLMSFAHP